MSWSIAKFSNVFGREKQHHGTDFLLKRVRASDAAKRGFMKRHLGGKGKMIDLGLAPRLKRAVGSELAR